MKTATTAEPRTLHREKATPHTEVMAARAEPAVAVKLDVRGLVTPEPYLQVAATLERMNPGEVIEVLNNDPFSVSDIIRWCSYEGIEYLELRYLPHGVDRFLLRKPRLEGAPLDTPSSTPG